MSQDTDAVLSLRTLHQPQTAAVIRMNNIGGNSPSCLLEEQNYTMANMMQRTIHRDRAIFGGIIDANNGMGGTVSMLLLRLCSTLKSTGSILLGTGRELASAFASDLPIQDGKPNENLGDVNIYKRITNASTWYTDSPMDSEIREAQFKDGAASSPFYQGFQDKILSLPPELSKMIMDNLFEEIFGPKILYPHRNFPVPSVFLALNRQLYRKYSDIYWSRSTWVIGSGSVHETMRFMTLAPYNTSTTEFSRQLPNNAALKIRRVKFRFTKDDLQRPSSRRQITRLNVGKEQKSIDSFQALEEYRSECKIFALNIMQLWSDKFDCIAFLSLDHLTIDFTEAYGPDGEFLGVDAVQRLLPFMYGMPVEFRILAPTKVLERQIRTAFYAINKIESATPEV